MTAPKKVCNDQVAGRDPSRVVHPLLLKVPHTEVEQTVGKCVFPLSYGARMSGIYNNFSLVRYPGPIVLYHLTLFPWAKVDAPGQTAQHPVPESFPGRFIRWPLRLLALLMFAHR